MSSPTSRFNPTLRHSTHDRPFSATPGLIDARRSAAPFSIISNGCSKENRTYKRLEHSYSMITARTPIGFSSFILPINARPTTNLNSSPYSKSTHHPKQHTGWRFYNNMRCPSLILHRRVTGQNRLLGITQNSQFRSTILGTEIHTEGKKKGWRRCVVFPQAPEPRLIYTHVTNASGRLLYCTLRR